MMTGAIQWMPARAGKRRAVFGFSLRLLVDWRIVAKGGIGDVRVAHFDTAFGVGASSGWWGS